MLKTIIISIWITSSLVMLFLHIISRDLRAQKGLHIPLWYTLMIIFCPIFHTYKCLKILIMASKAMRRDM